MPRSKKRKSEYRKKVDRRNRVRKKIKNYTELIRKYPNDKHIGLWKKKLGEFQAIQSF